jgi:hypothetical protein
LDLLPQRVADLSASTAGERARATCCLLGVLTQHGASRLLAPGYYECDLVKERVQWLFERRVVILDHKVRLGSA